MSPISPDHTIAPDRTVTTLAGLAGQTGTADGIGSAARFYAPASVATDPAGNVYVSDTSNHTIRKITPDGTVTTLAGVAGVSGSADGTGSAARFFDPYGLVVDRAGNLLVADTDNHVIRRITPEGVVTTIGGRATASGTADGSAANARFIYPIAIVIGASGAL